VLPRATASLACSSPYTAALFFRWKAGVAPEFGRISRGNRNWALAPIAMWRDGADKPRDFDGAPRRPPAPPAPRFPRRRVERHRRRAHIQGHQPRLPGKPRASSSLARSRPAATAQVLFGPRLTANPFGCAPAGLPRRRPARLERPRLAPRRIRGPCPLGGSRHPCRSDRGEIRGLHLQHFAVLRLRDRRRRGRPVRGVPPGA
jgi:hypothetical protein